LTVLATGRVVVGIGVGIAAMAVPMFLAEIAPPAHRGMIVAVNSLLITGGQFVAYVAASGIAHFCRSSVAWRLMLGLSAVPAFIQLVGMLYLPESPRFLARAGHHDHARHVLAQILGEHPQSPSVQDEMQEIIANLSTEGQRSGSSWRRLFSAELRPALIIAVGLQAFQQLGGINTAMYYSATIIKMAGFSSNSQAISFSVAVAFTNAVVTFISLKLIDRKGRRQLLLISTVGIIIALALLGGSFFLMTGFQTIRPSCDGYSTCISCSQDSRCGWCVNPIQNGSLIGNTCLRGDKDGPSFAASTFSLAITCSQWNFEGGCPNSGGGSGYLALCALVFYVAFFGLGLGTVPWVIQSEIFPLDVRGQANGAATASNWLCNLIVSMTFLTLADHISKAGTFWLYTGIAVCGLFFIYLHVPETKGCSLEEITVRLAGGMRGRSQNESGISYSEKVPYFLDAPPGPQSRFYRPILAEDEALDAAANAAVAEAATIDYEYEQSEGLPHFGSPLRAAPGGLLSSPSLGPSPARADRMASMSLGDVPP